MDRIIENAYIMIMDKQEISECRAEVITKFLDLERMVNIIISEYYLGSISGNFLIDVLYDPFFSFGLKINILEKIGAVKEGDIILVRKLNTIRNIFAHEQFGFVVEEKEEKIVFLDTKRGKEIDYAAEYRLFLQLYPNVLGALDKIYDDIREDLLKHELELSIDKISFILHLDKNKIIATLIDMGNEAGKRS